MMNNGFESVGGNLKSTSDLFNLVYASAQDARGSFADMSAVGSIVQAEAGDHREAEKETDPEEDKDENKNPEEDKDPEEDKNPEEGQG